MESYIMTYFYLAAAADGVGNFSQSIAPSLTGLVWALIILIVGIFLAVELGRGVAGLARRLGFDELFEKAGVKNFFGMKDSKLMVSSFLGWLVKWFILIFFFTLAVDALGLPEVTQFMVQILNYLPNLVAALAVMTVGLIIAEMAYEALHGWSEASGARLYDMLGMAARGLIILITVLVVLEQIGIQTTIIYIFAAGFALMLGLAGGLAFGLGGQTHAKELLDEVRHKAKKMEEGQTDKT